MKEIGIGIIGCGSVAEWKYLPELAKLPEASCRAFFGGRAAQAQQKYGAPDSVVCTSLAELLARDDVDAVCVCTPNHTHSSITVAALEAGKHVICEKPMAIGVEEAAAMCQAAKRSGKILTVGHQLRFHPTAQTLHGFIQDGKMGRPYFARASMVRRLGIPSWGHFTDLSMQGGGALIDLGTHALDLALWLMDDYEPAYCSAVCYQERCQQPTSANRWGVWNRDNFQVEDAAFGQIVMKSGAVVSIDAAWALHVPRDREEILELCGPYSGAVWTPEQCSINGVRNDQLYDEPLCRGDAESANRSQLQNFLRAVQGREEVLVTAEQSFTVCRVLNGLYRSAREGKPVLF